MKWPQNKKAKEEPIDEHNQPTEPMPRFILPAYTPPPMQANQPVAEPTISTVPAAPVSPLQQVPVVPGVPQPQQVLQPQQPLHYPQPIQAYNPYPNNPGLTGGVSPGVPALPQQPQATQTQPKEKGSKKPPHPRQPLYVGFFFVAVQFLLLARFILNLLNLPADNVWRDIVFTFSDVFLLPFYLLFRQMALPATVGPELYTLLAVLVYGIVSRILVRLLKTLFRNQQAQTP